MGTPARTDNSSGTGISGQTLLIAAVASATASFAVSKLWGPGTLVSAAATPVIVALVSEFLKRPVQKVSVTAKKAPTVAKLPAARPQLLSASQRPRRVTAIAPAGGESTAASEQQRRAGVSRGSGMTADGTADKRSNRIEDRQPNKAADKQSNGTSVTKPTGKATDALDGDRTEVHVYRRRPRWRLALVTGVVAFAIVVAFYTVSDAVAGHSITGNGQQTTFFGGSSASSSGSQSQTAPAKSSPTTSTPSAPSAGQTSTATTPTPTTPQGASPTTPSSSSSASSSTPPQAPGGSSPGSGSASQSGAGP